MASSGTVHQLVFTPDVAGQLIVRARFDGQRTFGSDWGAGAECRLFMNQGGTTVYADAQPLGASRLKYALDHTFTVVGGVAVTCGLYAAVSGASAVAFWNIAISPEHIKK